MVSESNKKEKTLHELFSNSFDRSPDGSILTHELKTVFSIMIICLPLEEKPRSSSNRLLNFAKKSFPFTFSITEAIDLLQELELNVEMNSTSIYISYSIKPELGYQLLNTFMKAKLLHTPADKTRSRPKENILLQPTPKGVAVTCDYARKFALKELPPILTSNFNTMNLFKFERNTLDDSVIQSEYFINLLFNKVMGPKPNIWSPKNPTDKIPKLSDLLDQRSSDVFSFENVSPDFAVNELGENPKNNVSGNSQSQHTENNLHSLNSRQLEDEDRESPFAYRFFSNPDSDSHIQYYVSDCGLRLFGNKTFGKGMFIDYCFTTKALWQWLMECTDIMYPKECVAVAALFLKYGLITPILLPPSQNSKKKFLISKTAHYTLTQAGWDVIQWGVDGLPKIPHFMDGVKIGTDTENYGGVNCSVKLSSRSLPGNSQLKSGHDFGTKNVMVSNYDVSSDSSSSSGTGDDNYNPDGLKLLSLKQILADPGMRYLFREHLCKDMCAENLDVYFEITKFLKRMSVLRKLIESRNQSEHNKMDLREWKTGGSTKLKDTIQSALLKQTSECLSLVYHIYSSYIALGSPYQLNIDHNVRETITGIIFHPQSPTKTAFDTSGKENCSRAISDASVNRPLSLDPAARKKCVEHKVQSHSNTSMPLAPTPLNKGTESYVIIHAISMLKDLYQLLEKIRNTVFIMMKNDSLPKFLATESYRDAISLITANK
ncbi:GTPase-activating protein SST2 [Kluyveromyces lactis]|uniref:KLLA0D10549p n=1 Tax=Kluyveromyces lactis (strain ATCC 8585 / CBS 2359 / DSM 70799 / NBRC 1267 / NRRL Y-1140 / WM37) TaxID=284590 RepID=Q6CRA8_KLULA|nr:uncharacterized protein KLLA0_D10549g [Kluyveromyces lactis]CAH00627.1 KLLA0D10549p [Kluyveromyces lactis]|eukprot:XP_453531.1 uncharacterized protein KLLA0_D10549g [Kluyveromyces lactis]